MADPLSHCVSGEVSEGIVRERGCRDRTGDGKRDRGEVRDRDRSDGDGSGSYSSVVWRASEDISWEDSSDIQECDREGDISEEAVREAGVVGRRVLDRWILRSDR